MPTFFCDLAGPSSALPHVWEHTVGSGHALLALRPDWQAQLKRCREELGMRHVRFHGILSDDVGTFTVHAGEPVHSFLNAHRIYDGVLEAGMRPFVELSFMPEGLASGTHTVFHYRGNVTPPRDLKAWGTLIERFVRSLVDRYGLDEVRRWPFEVWNEPNLKAFWRGSQADYFALYGATARAVKRVDPSLKVGGPATANNAWVADLIAFAEEEGLPVDFVSTHQYPTDAFGQPGDDTDAQLEDARRSVMAERARDVRAQAGGLPLYYTEWNTSSNPFHRHHDEPVGAAFAAQACLEVAGVVDAFSYWTFSDLFEENYFSSTPFHGGFGLLTVRGVPKPTYRAFELLHRLGDRALVVDGLHATVACWVTLDDASGTVVAFLTNHALPGRDHTDESVTLTLEHAPTSLEATVERVDAAHAHAKPVWEAMGSPDYPTPDQLQALHAASALVPEPVEAEREGDRLVIRLDLPRHGIAAVTLRPA